MKYIPLLKISDLPEGEKKRVVVEDRDLCIYHLSDGYFVTENHCTHAQGSLAEGTILNDNTIECPLHGALFAIRTGEVLSLPASIPIRAYPVKVEDGTLFLEVDDETQNNATGAATHEHS